MDLLSGGVEEDLYNDLYEYENSLITDDSFFESPILLAACSAEEMSNAINNKISSYSINFSYISNRYVDDDGVKYSKGTIGNNDNYFYQYASTIASAVKGFEFTDSSGYKCYIKECTGDGGSFISPEALTCSVYIK